MLGMSKEDLRILMGKNIRAERERCGMTIEELARVMNLTPGFVGLIERGRRGASASNLYKFVQIFNTSYEAIFKSDEKSGVTKEMEEMTSVLRRKLYSISHGLTENELYFLINQVKGIKEMNHGYITDDCEEV